MEAAGSDYIWKEQVVVLLFRCMSFVEIMKISSVCVGRVPSPSRAQRSDAAPEQCHLFQGSGLVLLDLSQVFIITGWNPS